MRLILSILYHGIWIPVHGLHITECVSLWPLDIRAFVVMWFLVLWEILNVIPCHVVHLISKIRNLSRVL